MHLFVELSMKINKMKSKLIIFSVIILASVGCKSSQSLVFTEQQFIGYKSDLSIPEKWIGEWSSEDGDLKCYIARDSFSITGIDYKIIPSNLDTTEFSEPSEVLDSSEVVNTSEGKDKLIFQDNWCYFSLYKEPLFLPGYWVFIANFDNKGNINFWEMSYDYFLKNQLVNKIPTIKFIINDYSKNTNKPSSDGPEQIANVPAHFYPKQIEEMIVYADVRGLSKREFNRLIKNTAISTEHPFYCEGIYDFEFFKKIAISRPPDLILTNTKNIKVRGPNKNEVMYEKISKKNAKIKYLKFVKN